MYGAKTRRGATPLRQQDGLSRKHLRGAAGLAVGGVLAAGLLLGGEDERNTMTGNTEPGRHTIVLKHATPDESGAAAVADMPSSPAALGTTEAALNVTPPPPPEPTWQDYTVQAGDSLSRIFARAGYNDSHVHTIVEETEGGKALARIYPGQTVSFKTGDNGLLLGLRHVISPLESTTYLQSDDGTGYRTNKEIRKPEVRTTWASGVIDSSLFLAGQEAGLSQNVIMDLANIFGGVIDFILDPRKGDTIHLLYQEHYLDGEKFRDGDILAAAFTNRGKTFNAYRYTDARGDINYFNEDGVSMRKAFLLAPLDFTRVSSNFNLRRKHPIYKTNRPHRGTDYAAPRGTPVYAAGDGSVTKAGYSKSNGNYIFVQHGEQYVTKYLHLNKRKVKTGARVSQGQVIGTVGSTGAATGPHLHYEFLVNGVHRNPRTIHKSLPKAKALPNNELPAFRAAIGEEQLQLATLIDSSNLASRDESASDTSSAP